MVTLQEQKFTQRVTQTQVAAPGEEMFTLLHFITENGKPICFIEDSQSKLSEPTLEQKKGFDIKVNQKEMMLRKSILIIVLVQVIIIMVVHNVISTMQRLTLLHSVARVVVSLQIFLFKSLSSKKHDEKKVFPCYLVYLTQFLLVDVRCYNSRLDPKFVDYKHDNAHNWKV